MNRFVLILIAALFLAAPVLAATEIQQYNQTWADTDNGGANIWTSLALWNKIYPIDNGNQALIVNTTVTSSSLWGINLTVRSGPFIQGVQGNKLYTLSRNKTYILGPFDLSRFKQSNETIVFQSNATRGKAIVVGLP